MPRTNARPAGRRTCQLFFGRPALEVAPELLGTLLTCNGVRLRLTEVEAYAGTADPASHAYRGSTARTAVMFGPPGHVYVYFVYGAHWAMNLVCDSTGTAAACLVRAGEVVSGLDVARDRRGSRVNDQRLASGPGNLARALGIDRRASGTSLWAGPVRWSPAPVPTAAVLSGPRVGVSSAADVPWRFWLPDEPSVSAYRRHLPRHRTAKRPSG